MTENSRCPVKWLGACLPKMLCQRARSPRRSRPRRCAISSSTGLSEAPPLRCFFCITSGHLDPVRGCGQNFVVLDAVDPPLVGLLGNEVQPELLADDTGEEAAHRMLLPMSHSHDRCNGNTS